MFLACAYLMQGIGAVGLIYSCGISMVCRIGYSFRILYRNYKWMNYRYILPPGSAVFSFVFVYTVLRIAKFYLETVMLVGIGAIVFVTHMYILYRKN